MRGVWLAVSDVAAPVKFAVIGPATGFRCALVNKRQPHHPALAASTPGRWPKQGSEETPEPRVGGDRVQTEPTNTADLSEGIRFGYESLFRQKRL